MTTLPGLIRASAIEAPEVLCGGTPCQAFSVAGNRQSLSDDRGNLTLVFCEVANAIDDIRDERGEQPAIIVWENVPGVLSTKDNAFGCFLAELAGESTPLIASGGKWANAGIVVGPRRSIAWRVLDAQYFGLAQRRKRVFVVASARDDIDIGKVLFEFQGNQRTTAPSRAEGNVVAINWQKQQVTATNELAHALDISGTEAVTYNSVIRRLTPRECERLQGFPDDYTLVPHRGSLASDAPRYKALGNSWPVPVVRWIGERIQNSLILSNACK
jgi:site-specific DNA-cytosine methylase